MEMEGDGSVPSAATRALCKAMRTSVSPIMSPITPSSPAPVGGGSETAYTAEEGKRLKTDPVDGGAGAAGPASSGSVGKSKSEKGAEVEEKDDKDEASGLGMPLVREELHPLQNPAILAHFFERCPPSLLAKCRLVSKQWLDLSLTSWRATSQLLLYDDNYRKANRLTCQQYLEFMDNPGNNCGRKPHRNLKLVSWDNDVAIQSFWKFWNQVGRNLTSLVFSSYEFGDAEELREIIFGSCPNLKALALRNCAFLESARAKDFRELEYLEPTFGEQTNLRVLSVEIANNNWNIDELPIHWLELLSHFPSLTTLNVSLNHRYYSFETEHEELFKAIQIIRQRDGKKLCISSFELIPTLKFSDDLGPHPDLSLFEELQLPLQFLEIEVDSSPKPRNLLLEDVLNRHQNTLSRVTVSRVGSNRHYYYSPDPYPWAFPCNVALEKLEQLQIHMLCTSMEFLKNMPNLKKLEFKFQHAPKNFEETRLFPEADASTLVGVKLLQLTEFRMDYRVTPEDVTDLARMMPNLRKLTMYLSDPLFGNVCVDWKGLKEVEVLGKDLTDKGVTGLAGDGGRALADITDLQGLESFKFWSKNLTDLSVFQGFLKLPSLKVLVCEEVKAAFGRAARKALKDRNIDFQENYEDETWVWDYDGIKFDHDWP